MNMIYYYCLKKKNEVAFHHVDGNSGHLQAYRDDVGGGDGDHYYCCYSRGSEEASHKRVEVMVEELRFYGQPMSCQLVKYWLLPRLDLVLVSDLPLRSGAPTHATAAA